MRAPGMIISLLAASALGACGSSQAPTPSPMPGNRVARKSPTTDPPTIAWNRSEFRVQNLPATARGGEIVVATMFDPDGGRGFPNLSLQVRTRDDKPLRDITVLAASDYERLVPDGDNSPELDKRIKDANRELAELHAQYDLLPMESFEMDGDLQAGSRRAFARGLVVEWLSNRLVVRRDDGTELASVDGSRWLPAPAQRCAQCPPCSHPAYLEAVYKAQDVDLIAIRLAFLGNDTCWEPAPQLHVVAFSSPASAAPTAQPAHHAQSAASRAVRWSNITTVDNCFYFSGPFNGRDELLRGEAKVIVEGARIRVQLAAALFVGTIEQDGAIQVTRTMSREQEGAWTVTETITGTYTGGTLRGQYLYEECGPNEPCPGRCTMTADLIAKPS